MQRKKQTKPIKQIILFIIIVILALLLIFAEDIIKLTNKNQTNLAENTPNDRIELIEPNIPVLSAGMIPVKWDGTNWVITTQNDTDWYDYKAGKPAYIMLNDGTYQSELIRNMEQNGKKLASDAVGNDALVVPSDLGTIFMWIPRFAYNEQDDIKYIKDVAYADENWTIPDIFTYAQTSETAPDFLLTGIWLQKDADTNYTTKISQMNQEESKYGFIKHTIAVSSNQTTQTEIQKYIVGASIARPQITEITNSNRIILRIINQNNQDPIKAKASYNKGEGLITVQVTYSQYGIAKIILEETNELNFTKTKSVVTAYSTGIDLEAGENTITIIDNNGNTKELKVTVVLPIYAVLYTDGTLALGKSKNPIPSKEISRNFGDISEITSGGPWLGYRTNIKVVEFVDRISPFTTEAWFTSCENLTTINKINNLNTSNVTDMSQMFYYCSSLNELDLSNFDTSNVTEMDSMFSYCDSLEKLDLSSFDTSKVTDMSNMFFVSRNLIEIDVSSFDTSKVTMMPNMFNNCNNLSKIDVSSFDTSNVKSMNSMFYECNDLSELDLSSFDTTNVTDIRNFFSNCTSLSQIGFGEKWDKEITLPRLTKPCTGWYSDAEFTNKVANAGANYKPVGPITIYADVPPNIYVTLYTDGTLAFAESRNPFPEKIIAVKYEDVSEESFIGDWTDFPWYEQRESITTVDFVNKISPISTASWFAECKNLTTINHIENLDTSKVKYMQNMFYACSSLKKLDLRTFDTSNVTDMHSMFNWCPNLTKIDVSSFNTSNVTNMSLMFSSCESLTEIDVSNFDTSNVTNMNGMFLQCKNLKEIDVSNFNTSNVTDIGRLFGACGSLTKIDISSFNIGNSSTSKVTNMNAMFSGCTNLIDLNLGNFDTSNVTNMWNVFTNCSSLTSLNLSSFNTSNVTGMIWMFAGCTNLTQLDLSNFNTRKVNNMSRMFYDCSNLKTIYVGTYWRLASNTTDMFTNCGTSSVTNK